MTLLYRRISKAWIRFKRWRWIRSAKRQAKYSKGTLDCQSDLKLDVPLRVNGRGSVILENRVSIGYAKGPMIADGAVLMQARKPSAVIEIKAGTSTNNNVTVIANHKIEIGENCLIGDMVCIYDSDFHEIRANDRHRGIGIVEPVKIGNNVWIGSRVLVLKGVNVGDNSVLAAGAIVVNDVPPNVIAGGVPAKVLKTINN